MLNWRAILLGDHGALRHNHSNLLVAATHHCYSLASKLSVFFKHWAKNISDFCSDSTSVDIRMVQDMRGMMEQMDSLILPKAQ